MYKEVTIKCYVDAWISEEEKEERKIDATVGFQYTEADGFDKFELLSAIDCATGQVYRKKDIADYSLKFLYDSVEQEYAFTIDAQEIRPIKYYK